jgi:uncharacterized membrane protein YhiD involved in acid resistance
MDTPTFCLHAAVAALLGTAIGFERQWGLHTIGLRTNALVSFGACLYVSVPKMLGGIPTAAQLAGQVVVGVGFLGGGVILREGLNVKGMNTAATLWCSAAVGALAGAGLLAEALAIQGVTTEPGGSPAGACVVADIHSLQRDDRTMEELMALVNDEPSVVSVSWEKHTPA